MKRGSPAEGSVRRFFSKRLQKEVLRDDRRIVVRLPEETFTEIRGHALKAGTSFSEQVRLLVERGLAA